MSLVAGASGRAVSGLADQVVSSATNFAVNLVAARSLGASDFGVFSLLFATYLLVLGAMRAVAGEPLVVGFSAAEHERSRAAPSAAAAGLAVTVGLGAAVACLALGAALGGSMFRPFVTLAVVLPGLMLQDVWRWVFFTAGNPGHALANDAVWTAGTGLAFALVLLLGHPGVAALLLAWGLPAYLAAGFGLAQSRLRPAPARGARWLKGNRPVAGRFLTEFVVGNGLVQLMVYVVAVVAGGPALGTYRAGLVLLAPLNVLLIAFGMYGVPEGVRSHAAEPGGVIPLFGRVAAALALVCVGLGIAIHLIPERLGTAILGTNWHGAHALAIPLSISYAGYAVAAGAAVGLRSIGAYQASVLARLWSGGLVVVGVVVGAAVDAAMGAAVGSAVGSVAGALVWWRTAKRSADVVSEGIPDHRPSRLHQ